MKHRITIFFFLFFANCIFSQTKKSIDSINNIAYETKLENCVAFCKVYKKNASDAKKINYPLGEAESYSNLSLMSFFSGKFDDNFSYSLQAIAIYEKLNEIEKLANEYGEMGFRMNKRNPKKALYYMQKGMKISEKNKFQKPLLGIYNNYGTLKQQQNELDSALYFFRKCLKIKESIKDSVGIPYSLNNIAEIFIIRKQFAEAKKLFDKSLKIRILRNDKYGIADSYAYLGDLNHAEKKYDEAILNYDKSLEFSLKYKFNNLLRHNYKMISECYEYSNNSKAALVAYKKHVFYKDSILNTETNSKIAELEVKFETKNKEKQLLEKEIEVKNTRNKLIAVSSLALFIGLIGYLIYRQQKLKNIQQKQEFQLKSAISVIETQNKLHEQRLSISRDLHDNIGAQLTFVISSIDNLKFGNKIKDSKVTNQLTKISDFTRATIIELRDTIWAMNNSEFVFEDLRSRIFNFIEKAKFAREDVAFKFTIDEALQDIKLSSLVGINIYRTIQEAINNAVKYSEASEISVDITNENDQIKIEIQDNGKGFDINTIDFGNGLYNMKKRVEEVAGVLKIESNINRGTIINILINKNQ
ncbi:tetratricopeptide repeat-containing sensor histidine kinase [Flavobacterium aquatile]|uniref:tetratricopeptide repeat-containing sensor histidine kinase n=1 Tax=Flavobacterium aquatile TaxID=245 RepID=UPI00068D7A86|nr:sensor histidine kinase [Flavobacterium aquatile]OXA66071.1 two-component sensor histidine kinase [Flavobacterium aquatile LMG 4008 = ATCC 11947]GEC77552.1 two-component sensor histidine kinase [Flavobacterium aquatile]